MADPVPLNQRTLQGYIDQITAPSGVAGSVSESFRYTNQSATRDLPITPALEADLRQMVREVYGPGYTIEVYSGGQVPRSQGGRAGVNRVGTTTNHDSGQAADVHIVSPSGEIVRGKELAKAGQWWGANAKGQVGLEMRGGGIHLGHANKRNWDYDNPRDKGVYTPAQRELIGYGYFGRDARQKPNWNGVASRGWAVNSDGSVDKSRIIGPVQGQNPFGPSLYTDEPRARALAANGMQYGSPSLDPTAPPSTAPRSVATQDTGVIQGILERAMNPSPVPPGYVQQPLGPTAMESSASDIAARSPAFVPRGAPVQPVTRAPLGLVSTPMRGDAQAAVDRASPATQKLRQWAQTPQGQTAYADFQRASTANMDATFGVVSADRRSPLSLGNPTPDARTVSAGNDMGVNPIAAATMPSAARSNTNRTGAAAAPSPATQKLRQYVQTPAGQQAMAAFNQVRTVPASPPAPARPSQPPTVSRNAFDTQRATAAPAPVQAQSPVIGRTAAQTRSNTLQSLMEPSSRFPGANTPMSQGVPRATSTPPNVAGLSVSRNPFDTQRGTVQQSQVATLTNAQQKAQPVAIQPAQQEMSTGYAVGQRSGKTAAVAARRQPVTKSPTLGDRITYGTLGALTGGLTGGIGGVVVGAGMGAYRGAPGGLTGVIANASKPGGISDWNGGRSSPNVGMNTGVGDPAFQGGYYIANNSGGGNLYQMSKGGGGGVVNTESAVGAIQAGADRARATGRGWF